MNKYYDNQTQTRMKKLLTLIFLITLLITSKAQQVVKGKFYEAETEAF